MQVKILSFLASIRIFDVKKFPSQAFWNMLIFDGKVFENKKMLIFGIFLLAVKLCSASLRLNHYISIIRTYLRYSKWFPLVILWKWSLELTSQNGSFLRFLYKNQNEELLYKTQYADQAQISTHISCIKGLRMHRLNIMVIRCYLLC